MINYLLLVHKNFNQAELLINKLKTKNSKIYVHIDGKIKEFPLFKNANILKKRIKTNWGGFSLVQCELNGMFEIYKNMKKGDHLIVISGQCRPIEKINNIEKYINNLKNESCIDFEKITDNTKKKVNKYYFNDLDLHIPQLNKILYNLIEKIGHNMQGSKIPIINTILSIIVSAILPKRNYLLSNYKIYKGGQWICISYKHIKQIINFLKTAKGKKFYNSFKYTNCPDEIFFQTLLYNLPIKSELRNETLWYTNWEGNINSPNILTIDYYYKIIKSKKLFARKFDINVDWDIIKKLENMKTQKEK